MSYADYLKCCEMETDELQQTMHDIATARYAKRHTVRPGSGLDEMHRIGPKMVSKKRVTEYQQEKYMRLIVDYVRCLIAQGDETIWLPRSAYG